MRPRYPHKKQVKTDYEAQFSIGLVLNNEIEKKINKKYDKKQPESTRVNCLSTIFESWGQNNIIESKQKNIIKSNSQPTQY